MNGLPDEIYVEYRRWKLWWGLFIDSQVEVNALIAEHNRRGYRTVMFHHHNGLFPNIPFFTLLLIWLVSTVSLGFVTYYVGPSFVFIRETSGELQRAESDRRIREKTGHWACPRCTTENPGTTYKCGSCGYSLM